MQWYEDDDLWNSFYDCLFGEDSFRRAADDVPCIRQLTGVEAGSVLDLGCGPGRYSIPLARAGFNVTAVDLSPYLLERAREREDREDVGVEWVRADMREFHREAAFDLAVSMMTSFGYFEDPADDIRVLENVHYSLAEGGILLMDMAGKEWICRNLQPVHLTEFEDGRLLVERPAVADNFTWIDNEWVLVDGERVVRHRWGHRLYSGQELADRLFAAGFAEVSLYGGLDGSNYDLDAERLVALAVKPV